MFHRAKKELSTVDGIVAAAIALSVPFICAYIGLQ